MKKFLELHFKLSENNTNIKKEAIGGTTTFMTMSYIIFVQPLVLSAAAYYSNNNSCCFNSQKD